MSIATRLTMDRLTGRPSGSATSAARTWTASCLSAGIVGTSDRRDQWPSAATGDSSLAQRLAPHAPRRPDTDRGLIWHRDLLPSTLEPVGLRPSGRKRQPISGRVGLTYPGIVPVRQPDQLVEKRERRAAEALASRSAVALLSAASGDYCTLRVPIQPVSATVSASISAGVR